MKKTRFLIFLLTAVLLMSALTSCGKDVISLVAVYKGETLTTTDHVFTTDDFDVYLTYSDGSEKIVNDGYEIEQKGMKGGYYIMDITAEGYTEEVYVKTELDIFEKSDVTVQN